MLKKSDQVHQLMNPPTNLRTWTVRQILSFAGFPMVFVSRPAPAKMAPVMLRTSVRQREEPQVGKCLQGSPP